MRISSRLKFAALAPLLMASVTGFALLISHTRIEKALERRAAAQRIINNVHELNTLAHYYMRYREDRPKRQFLLEHGVTMQLLSTTGFKEREKELLDSIRKNSEAMKSSFLKLVSSYEEPDPGIDAALLREARERLAGRLLARSREVLSDAVLLENQIVREITATRRWTNSLILVLIVATTLPLTIVLLRMMTGITRSLAALGKGTRIVGAGDLDYRIGMTSPDEIGDLSRSFDRMAAQLKESTVSRDELGREVEERKAADEALRENQSRLETVFAAIPNVMIEYDAAGRSVRATAAALKAVGLGSPGFSIDQAAANLRFRNTDGSDVRSEDLPSARALRGETVSGDLYSVRTVDGIDRVVSAYAAPLYREDGSVSGALALWHEITELKRAEESSRESRAKLEAALASMTDAVSISDGEGRFIEFNDAFATFHRFADRDECAKTFAEYPDILDVFLPDGTAAPLDMWAVPRALRGERATNAEYILHRKDTNEYWIGSYSFAPIRDKHGVIVGAVVVGRDISEHKEAEQALQEAYVEMSKLVEERTRELKEKEVLLKEIHHRVKNNLQVISSLVGLQADGSGDETVREVLRDVTYRVRSMALVHEKLYQSVDLASIDFAEYSRGLLGYLWRAHGSSAAAVRLTLDLSPVSLPVDTAVPCGLILNELAGNALKHAFRGRSEGDVTVLLKSGADGRISLSVADNGVGLPAGFDWREAKSLGLRLVQMLSAQIGGEVKVESSEGTRFEISFGL